MENVRVLIVEDEVIIADNICDALEDFGYEVLEPAITYAEAIQAIETFRPDIAVLDIQLSGKKSGIDLAETINEKFNMPFLFLTSNSDKITLEQAKRAEPYAYLIKPFSKDELYTSIEVAMYNYSKQKEKAVDQQNLIIKEALFIRQNKAFKRLNFEEILYLKSDHVYIDIVMKDDRKYTVRGSLNDYISKMGMQFARCHRSFIVNLDHMDEIYQNYITVRGEEIPIGKKHREDLLARINMG